MQILGYVNRVRDVEACVDNAAFTMAQVESNAVRCPDADAAQRMYDSEHLSLLHETQQHELREPAGVAHAILKAARSASQLPCLPSAADTLTLYDGNRKQSHLRVPDLSCDNLECTAIDEVRTRGDSCGGEVTCVVRKPPMGLGSPVFDKLEAELAKAAMSLPASKVSLKH